MGVCWLVLVHVTGAGLLGRREAKAELCPIHPIHRGCGYRTVTIYRSNLIFYLRSCQSCVWLADLDECSSGSAACACIDAECTATCFNSLGSYICGCSAGFEIDPGNDLSCIGNLKIYWKKITKIISTIVNKWRKCCIYNVSMTTVKKGDSCYVHTAWARDIYAGIYLASIQLWSAKK